MTADRPGSAFSPGGQASPDGPVTGAADLLRALANPSRLEILCLLLEGERSVSELEQALGMAQARVSQLLTRLRSDGVVSARRSGRHVLYRISRPEVAGIIRILRGTFCAV